MSYTGPTQSTGCHRDACDDKTQLPPVSNGCYDNSVVDDLLLAMKCSTTREQLHDDSVHSLSLVPEGFIPLPHQLGGQDYLSRKPGSPAHIRGLLRCIDKPHLLYKPISQRSNGVREASFYDALYGNTHLKERNTFPSLCSSEGTSSNRTLRNLIPQYHGLTSITDRSGHSSEYIILEDITHRFANPCILDLKLGQRTWDDTASEAKIKKHLEKYPRQKKLGFAIVGMKVYKHLTKDYVYYDRFYGRSVREDTALDAISHFFDVGDGTRRSDVVHCILTRLPDFMEWMETQTSLRVFGTSLLIVYEGGPIPKPDEKTQFDMRLVDFSHLYERPGCDVTGDGNAVFGVRRFMEYLQLL